MAKAGNILAVFMLLQARKRMTVMQLANVGIEHGPMGLIPPNS
ncbi:hypothetical protein [Thermicanus aegyptius]|nr:hypothetical protein [Thermicanus aegyptius]